MRLAIMQPYFFPYIGYFQLIHSVDEFLFYDNLNYIKYGWINRNRFLVKNGVPTYFRAQVDNNNPFQKIRDVRLSADPRWRKTLLRSIDLNYRKWCPHFPEVYSLVSDIVSFETLSLSEFNRRGVTEISNFLGLETKIIFDDNRFGSLEARLDDETKDLAGGFPDIKLETPAKMVVRGIEVCRKMGADVLVNPIGGRDLYKKRDFAENGIELFFLKTRGFTYSQTSSPFFPNLSIIDVLMCCGREKTAELIRQYDLI